MATAPSPAMIDLVILERRLTAAEDRLLTLEARTKRRSGPSDPGDIAADAMNLHEGLVARGLLHERTAAQLYGRHAVDYALVHGLARRDASGPRIKGWGLLTAADEPTSLLERIVAAVSDGPQSAAILRTLPGLAGQGKALTDAIDRGIHEGRLRRGTLRTGSPGRPGVVVARADRPLPTHWDTHKVDWDRA